MGLSGQSLRACGYGKLPERTMSFQTFGMKFLHFDDKGFSLLPQAELDQTLRVR